MCIVPFVCRRQLDKKPFVTFFALDAAGKLERQVKRLNNNKRLYFLLLMVFCLIRVLPIQFLRRATSTIILER